jgi:hypothetical protein
MMNIIRLLTFELNRTCNMIEEHRGKCPISHPDRYKYSPSTIPLLDEDVLRVWRWAKGKGFRGIILWHIYNEPTLVLERIRALMSIMKSEDKFQPFQLTTNSTADIEGFDILKHSGYENGVELDNRIEIVEGEGKPYEEMPKVERCGRGMGWEIPIDYYGNWLLCCGDWRCEEAIGNIHHDSLDALYERWNAKRVKIQWHNEKEYRELPRLCRACMDKNPSLPWKGGI